MTQEELFARLSGVVKADIIVRLLKTVTLPFDGTTPLDECSFPSYQPAVAMIDQQSFPGSFPQADFDGKAEFYLSATNVTYRSEGIALLVKDDQGAEELFALSMFDDVMVIPYGRFTVNFSVSAQSFIGAA